MGDHKAPHSTFMQAFVSLELAEQKAEEKENQVRAAKDDTNKDTKRLERGRQRANYERKRAANRFNAKLSEAVCLFRDFHKDEKMNEGILNTLEVFFRKIKDSGRSALLFLDLVKDENPFCLDHVFRCNVVPDFLEDVLSSSKFFSGLQKKAIETQGGFEDAAGGFLAIKMFKLDEDAQNKLIAGAKEPSTRKAMMWLMDKTPEESDKRFVDDLTDDLNKLKKRAGLDEAPKSVLVQRDYELTEADKCKLTAAVQKQMEEFPVHWFVAYFLFKWENPDKELVGGPLNKFEKDGANALYEMFIEKEGVQPSLYSAAPPESSGADFRF
jgi:hypothetical protein